MALVMALSAFAAVAATAPALAGDPPPVIESISPDEVIEDPVPQPTITITGSNLRQPGVFGSAGQPTVTITHTIVKNVSFSVLASVNFSGTQVTIPPDDNAFNMLQMPLGVYDLTLTRPDGQSATVDEGFSLITQPEPEPGEIALEAVGYWGGPILGMDVDEDQHLAYIANGRMLRILDISDESNPTELGSIYLGGVNDVAVRDGYAFVAAMQPYGFCIVDVSEPTSPELVWSDGGARDQVELFGGHAYVREYGASAFMPVGVFDVSSPSSAKEVGELEGKHTIRVAGDRLYVGGSVDTGTMLMVYDLAGDPVAPPVITTWSGSGVELPGFLEARSIAVAGDYVHITGSCNGCGGLLLTVDLSDLDDPVLTFAWDNLSRPESAAVLDSRLYVSDARGNFDLPPSSGKGLVIYDITRNPAEPALLSTYKSHSTSDPYAVHAGTNGRIYVSDNTEGLIILDATDPTQPERLGWFHSPSSPTRMQKSGDMLFILDLYGGFTVLDVSDASGPQILGNYLIESVGDVPVAGTDIDFHDGLVYVSARNMGLEVIDVSDPTDPVFLGAYRFSPSFPCHYLAGVAVSGTTAYTGWRDGDCAEWFAHRLLTLDVSDPQDISAVGYSANAALPDQMEVNGTLVYATDSECAEYGKVYDVANAAAPVVLQPFAGCSGDLAHDSDLLFTTHDSSTAPGEGLHIWDASVNPADPQLLAHEDGFAAHAVDVQNSRAYVSTGGLSVYSIKDPSAPLWLADAAGSVEPVGGNGTSARILVDEPDLFITHQTTANVALSFNGLVVVDVIGTDYVVPADLDNSGTVGVTDLLILLSNWGTDGAGADLAEPSDVAGVADLLELLGSWN